jgi:hypothetical protein
MRREATVIGLPIAGFEATGVLTSEDDWVVTGVHRGQAFRRYVSSNATEEIALRMTAQGLKLTPDGLEWIKARRRREVEECIRLDGDWLRSRAL